MLTANSALRANSFLGYFTFSTQIKACKQNPMWISADTTLHIVVYRYGPDNCGFLCHFNGLFRGFVTMSAAKDGESLKGKPHTSAAPAVDMKQAAHPPRNGESLNKTTV